MSEAAEAVRVDTAPFDLPGAGRAAALCLHGLSGTPYEVRPLGEALARQGIRALGPVLPGHNDTAQALAAVRFEDWLETARGAARALREQHERVFGVGLSMGGLLTLDLAADATFDALVVVGTPLRLRFPIAQLVPLLRVIAPFPSKRGGSDIRDPAARARHPSLDVMPMASVRELQHLQRRVRGRLGRIEAPLLVAHGAHDRTAHPDDARAIRAGVASAQTELLVLPESGHVVPVDWDGSQLADRTAAFCARYV